MIDTSRIPQDKLTDPRFLQLHTNMMNALSNPLYINAFCVHEAAHIIYFRRMGATEFTLNGPRIEYDQAMDEFDGYMADVKVESLNMEPSDVEVINLVRQAARGHAAGGIVARAMTNVSDGGDEEDRRRFISLCEAARISEPAERQAIWLQAGEDVRQDLRSPAFKSEIWAKAKEIKLQIFGAV